MLNNASYDYIYNKFVIFVPYCDHYYDFIIPCLKSIVLQNYPNYEIIIVNDGSLKIDHIVDFFNNHKNIIYLT